MIHSDLPPALGVVLHVGPGAGVGDIAPLDEGIGVAPGLLFRVAAEHMEPNSHLDFVFAAKLGSAPLHVRHIAGDGFELDGVHHVDVGVFGPDPAPSLGASAHVYLRERFGGEIREKGGIPDIVEFSLIETAEKVPK